MLLKDTTNTGSNSGSSPMDSTKRLMESFGNTSNDDDDADDVNEKEVTKSKRPKRPKPQQSKAKLKKKGSN